MQNKESKFNWKLPLYGMIGFGIGLIIGNVFLHIFGKSLTPYIETIIWGILIGTIGGAALGLALKDIKKIRDLSIKGAVGFALGFTFGTIIVSFLQNNVGDIVPYVIAYAITGAIGGATLGLALKDRKKIFYLSCAGTIGFPIGFVICFIVWGESFLLEYFFKSALGFAIGGATIGLTLACLIKNEKIEKINSNITKLNKNKSMQIQNDLVQKELSPKAPKKKKRSILKIIALTLVLLLIIGLSLYFLRNVFLSVKVSIDPQKTNYELGNSITIKTTVRNYSPMPYPTWDNAEPSISIKGLSQPIRLIREEASLPNREFINFLEIKTFESKFNLINQQSFSSEPIMAKPYDLVVKSGQNIILSEFGKTGQAEININSATFSNDKMDCSLFTDNYRKSSCFLVERKVEPTNENCALGVGLQKDNCYEEYYQKTGDYSVCPKIEDSMNQESCYLEEAKSKKDYSFCNKIENTPINQTVRNDCFEWLAEEKHDSTFCQKIDDPQDNVQKNRCITTVTQLTNKQN